MITIKFIIQRIFHFYYGLFSGGYNAICWYVLVHYSIRTDPNVISNYHPSYYFSTGPNETIVTNNWRPNPF